MLCVHVLIFGLMLCVHEFLVSSSGIDSTSSVNVMRSIDVTSAWVLALFWQDMEQKDFIKLKLKLWDSRPQEQLTWWPSVTLVLVHKTNGILVVTVELSIIGIWCITSASNLSINSITRQQWNFPLGIWHALPHSSGWLEPAQTRSI